MTFGVGLALFAFLGLFISAASARYNTAQTNMREVCKQLNRILCLFFQGFQVGAWQEGDHERIVWHLVAYPICLKISLRMEHDGSQSEQILHPSNVDDIMNAPVMHFHCAKVLRAYFSSACNMAACFTEDPASLNMVGWGSRFYKTSLVEDLDAFAASSLKFSTSSQQLTTSIICRFSCSSC